MTIYHLNIYNGIGLVEDEEGQELADIAAARAAAIEGIRSLISEEAKTGIVDLTGRIEVTDADGHQLCTIRYADAVNLRLSGGKS